MEQRAVEQGKLAVDVEKLMDHLTETAALELFIAEMYLQYADQARDSEIRRSLREFGGDADRHRQIVGDLLEQLGGHPSWLKEIAATTLAWGKGFRDIARRGRGGMLWNLYDLLLAERRIQLSWEMIKAVGEVASDQRLLAAAEKVLPGEQRHVDWLHNKVMELARETMVAVRVKVRTGGVESSEG